MTDSEKDQQSQIDDILKYATLRSYGHVLSGTNIPSEFIEFRRVGIFFYAHPLLLATKARLFPGCRDLSF